MLIAREGEEIVCPKGTVCGRMTRDANDQITDGDFAMLETCVSLGDQRYVCGCCERAVAVREHFRWPCQDNRMAREGGESRLTG